MMPGGAITLRAELMKVYRQAVDRLSGRRQVAEFLFDHPFNSPFHVLAVGKAALSMAEGAHEVGGDCLRSGLVIHPLQQSAEQAPDSFTTLPAEHPLPGPGSFRAGKAVLDFMDSLPLDEPLLVLLSGGGSSLMEAPRKGVSEQDLHAVHEWLLGSGLDIVDVNRVRQCLSAVKGGALARRLNGCPAQVLCLSDVPPGQLPALASGPFLPPLGGSLPPLPDWISVLVGDYRSDATAAIRHHLLADAATLRNQVAAMCEDWDLPVRVMDEWLEGDAADVGRRLAETVLEAPPGIHVWSGETTVTLPQASGQGGRCQQLALAAAERLEGQSNVYFLACGSDGLDGPSGDAGAVVDGETVARGSSGELTAEDALDWADAGRFLGAAGDLVHIGPTETNINDLIIGLKLPSR
ncbi:hydroxypyruvate reductase [Natronospira proteinivora]|uniref:Hydroxypyruvate reductase n=1 Tax=Natronospira proteinivora TaxID=1807133 RepID=A0ABT1G722_9GAMM|nr:DUF4147 domain-containing protein [Natronospira proteinivora]MCP1727094.1 hydroxypyruvate reductase [Natronospira proteinivora]